MILTKVPAPYCRPSGPVVACALTPANMPRRGLAVQERRGIGESCTGHGS
ncbi:MAG TPA: hypothetical protein VNW30_10670 [Opitutaceae bacterium]|nr:hypothetical protein [Opitutaceae bacterium]